MTNKNGYATLTQFLAYMPNSGDVVTDLAERAIMSASRAIDRECGLHFFPKIETALYDTPTGSYLDLHKNLLEMITLTNGDGTEITSSNYKLWPYNYSAKREIRLNPDWSGSFEESDDTWDQAAISVLAIFGYHSDYAQAWVSGSTLNGALTDSATSFVVASSTLFEAGNIIRIDNELMLITAITTATHTLTVTRAWNGSTAAAHDASTAIYYWEYESDIVTAALIQSVRYYQRQNAVFGTVGGGELGVQPVTITSLDPDVKQIIKQFQFSV